MEYSFLTMRIASLVPSATEMLFALGLGDTVVGVTHECDYPPAALNLPHLTRTVLNEGLDPGQIDAAVKATVSEGRALYELDEELLAELAPDLIVTQAVCDVCAVSFEDVVEVAARLETNPRVLQQDPSTLGEMLEDVIRLGEAAGIEAAAHELRGELEGRLATVRAAVGDAARPRVIALEWLDPPYVGGHWVPEMISIAGGEDVAGPPGLKSPAGPVGRALRPPPRHRRLDALRLVRRGGPRADARALGAGRGARAPSASSRSTPPPPSPGPGRGWSTGSSCSATSSTPT